MKRLLTRNSELRRIGAWNWTLPAWVAKRSDGVAVLVCPAAGACVKVCYARNGTYLFPNVKAAHTRNLEMVMDDLGGWMTAMLNEVGRLKPTGTPHLPDLPRDHLHPDVAALLDEGAPLVRIHDSGDFFSEEYLLAWLGIAQMTPRVLFYAYTKEVALMKRAATDAAPTNFLWVYSMGGKQDPLVDRDTDRHADVFPDEAAIEAAGYYSQEPHDLLCVVAPSHRVGIPANNIPAFRKRLAGRTFSELEQDVGRRSA